jgi:hypothetical protein
VRKVGARTAFATLRTDTNELKGGRGNQPDFPAVRQSRFFVAQMLWKIISIKLIDTPTQKQLDKIVDEPRPKGCE